MTTRPNIDIDSAGRHAARWGLRGARGQPVEVRELGSYADRNFAVTEAGGDRYVLKFAAIDEPRGVLELQDAALAWLAERPSAAVVPRVRPTEAGERLVEVEDARGRPTLARALTWVAGELWIDLPRRRHTSALRRSLGAALGQLARDLEGFEHPAMRRSFRWNLVEADWIAEHLGALRAVDDPRVDAVLDALLQFRGRVLPRLGELPHQVIHGDANDQNIVVAGESVCGLFDLGDMCWAPTVCDLAIALAYVGMGGSDDRTLAPEDAIDACAQATAGFHARRPLGAIERDLLFDLVRARLAVSVVSSTLARAAEPNNAYVGSSERAAWTLLDSLTVVGRARFDAALASACDLPAPARGGTTRDQLLARRRERIGPSLSLSYTDPLYIRRGEGCYLFDEHDHAFLDCVNNVCHVGHCHPTVVEAGARQMARLNTNTRYLHEGILDYADRLCATLPDPLEVVFLVCSGSEANELALRLARDFTGGHDVAVIAGAYHGNTGALVDLSSYKFDGPGGRGRQPWVHLVPTPDPYRGAHGDDGPAYAVAIDDAAAAASERGGQLAAFLAESMLGCAGQIDPATGFLAAAFERARAAGAVCIADEVQVGFGRVGDAMWAFEAHDVVPDILTLGKPIANGHPVGAVVTTRAIAERLGNRTAAGGMEYFNTFGGNPVSCAVASAVLEVIDAEGLMTNARETGQRLLAGVRHLALHDPGIGDVRGRGLFLGVELVRDRDSKAPDPERAAAVIDYARRRGVLISVDGPHHNVLKVKPPLCFGAREADILLHIIHRALLATHRQPRAQPTG